MCNKSKMVFFDVLKTGRSLSDVKITNAKGHGYDAIRISLSSEAINRIGENVERLIVGLDPDYKNRLYFFNAKDIPGCKGYALITAGENKNGRKYIRIDSRSLPGYDVLKTIGEYNLERDNTNDLFIALKSTI